MKKINFSPDFQKKSTRHTESTTEQPYELHFDNAKGSIKSNYFLSTEVNESFPIPPPSSNEKKVVRLS